MRRELTFRTGKIDIATPETLRRHRTYTFDDQRDVDGTLDDGQLTNIDGDLKVRGQRARPGVVRLDADSIPFHIPQTLDLVVSASDVRLALDDRARTGGSTARCASSTARTCATSS